MVLHAIGFRDMWRKWIKACLITSTISILFNGTSSKLFKMKRGIRQRDPLSLFLFLLMAEVLNKMMLQVVLVGMCKGLGVGCRNIHISHLQFADDILIFTEADVAYLQNVKKFLSSFQFFSRLSVNYIKSGFLVLGKDD